MKINYGIGSGFVLVVMASFGIFIFVQCIEMMRGVAAGHALYPLTLAVTFFLLIGLELVRMFKSGEWRKTVTIEDPISVGFIILALFVYWFVFKYWGYYPGTIIFALSVCVFLQKHKSIKTNLFHSVIAVAGYLLFVRVVFVEIFGLRL